MDLNNSINDDSINVIKFKYLDFNKITFNNLKLLYNNNNDFYIQTPIFKNYNLVNYNNKIYLQLIINNDKTSHLKFLSFIDTIEIILKNNNIFFKSQIIRDNLNTTIKIKLSDNYELFDKSKKNIHLLSNKKIILLINFNILNNCYSIISNQILEI